MNEKLKELISISSDEATSEDDELLIEEVITSQLIMPIEVISADEDDFQFKPLKLANENNEEFIALFSDEDELVKGNIEISVISISSKNLAEMIKSDSKEYFGVAINPFSKYSLAIPLKEFLDLF